MISIDWHPDDKKLRQFAWLWLAAFIGLGLMTAWRLGTFDGSGVVVLPAIFGIVSLAGLIGIVVPRAIRIGYLVLTAISYPIGLVLGHVLLGFIYFALFTPLALVFRLIGRDALHRRFDAAAASYFADHPGPPEAGRYLRQF